MEGDKATWDEVRASVRENRAKMLNGEHFYIRTKADTAREARSDLEEIAVWVERAMSQEGLVMRRRYGEDFHTDSIVHGESRLDDGRWMAVAAWMQAADLHRKLNEGKIGEEPLTQGD